MSLLHSETHRTHRIGWLRAAVLGANDGVISTASLIVGVAAAGTAREGILVSGIAGLVAGAMSMAAGEFVSVQSQADTENADIAREKHELEHEPERELDELTAIYRSRGLDDSLARRVAEKLMETDALAAHARDELGIHDGSRARPVQAAFASAASFTAGAAMPLVAAVSVPAQHIGILVAITALVMLSGLGALAGYAGGASPSKGALRVAFWGMLAMTLTAGAGRLFGAS